MEDNSETGVLSVQFMQIGLLYSPGEELSVFKCSPSDNNNQVFTIVPGFKPPKFVDHQHNVIGSSVQPQKLPSPPPPFQPNSILKNQSSYTSDPPSSSISAKKRASENYVKIKGDSGFESDKENQILCERKVT